MKPIILTDKSCQLTQSQIDNKDIFVINSDKSALGQIVYTLDILSSTGTDIIYLSSHEFYKSVILACEKIASMHSKNAIIVIDTESSSLTQEELIKNVVSSKNIIDTLTSSQCSYNIVYDKNEESLLKNGLVNRLLFNF